MPKKDKLALKYILSLPYWLPVVRQRRINSLLEQCSLTTSCV